MRKLLVVALMALCVVSCSKSTENDKYKEKLDVKCDNLEPRKVEIIEYNKALFSIDTANFYEGIQAIRPQFQVFLGDSLTPHDVQYFKNFVTDDFAIKINELTEKTFPNIALVSNKVKGVYQHLKYYYPDIKMPPTYTYVSGLNLEYNPVMINPEEFVIISLDFYLDNKDFVYDQVGMPRYISRNRQPSFLTHDLSEAIYKTYIKDDSYQYFRTKDVLTEMIDQGKKYLFIEAMDPSMNDSIILGYSSKQMEWAKENEGEIWDAVVGNNMLYAKGMEQFRVLFGDGPCTQGFGKSSPARLGDFIGLQIVRSFLSNNDDSFLDLMKNTDYQDIFQRSQYKPRK